MPILSADIKFLASERLTDNADGGGRITGNEIVDGQSNNLFPDISDLDRVYGRVSLRKAFVGIRTDDTAVYFGGHLIAQAVPADPNVSVTLFSTQSPTDERQDARDRIESYVVMGPESRMRLLEDQLIGQRSLTTYQATDAPQPEVGDVYALSTESGGHDGEIQFVRLTSVDSETRTFVDSQGEFDRAVLTLGTGNPLRFRCYGQAATRRTDIKPPTRFRQTTVANAAQYFGTVPLQAAGTLGDLTLQLDSIYTRLVPSAQAESPLTDVPASGDKQLAIAAGPARTVSIYVGNISNTTVYLDGPITPGSLEIGGTITDDAQGNLIKNGSVVGVVDYARGAITPDDSAGLANNSYSVTYQPAAAVQAQTFSLKTDVTLGTRAYTYVANLRPIPAPGTTVVDYRAQKKWYRLRDNGKGELVGDIDGSGTGRVDFQTGSVTATLAALPDVDTAIIYFWNTYTRYLQNVANVDFDYEIRHDFGVQINPSDFTISWTSGSQARSATATAGVLAGDGTGRITAAGQLSFTPTFLPDSGASFDVDYNTAVHNSVIATVANGDVAGTLGTLPVRPGSVEIVVLSDAPTLDYTDPQQTGTPEADPSHTLASVNFIFRDDGAGSLVGAPMTSDSPIVAGPIGPVASGTGTIDYATGAYTLHVSDSVLNTKLWAKHQEAFGAYKYTYEDGTATYVPGANAAIGYVQDNVAGTAQLDSFAAPALEFDLTPDNLDRVVPSSVLFTFAGATYADREGKLYRNVDPITGAGIESGSVNYVSGRVSLDVYPDGGGALAALAVLTQYQEGTISAAALRTSGAPLRPGSFFVRATDAEGTLHTATADANGDLSNDDITGHIDVETGVVELAFATPVMPNTLFYNAVVYSYLPLDADILGLDPVRLPQDGRVPVFEPGRVAVVHHTARVAEATLTADQVLDAGRVRLAYAAIEDAAGTALDPSLYTADRDAGKLTMANPLDLSAYTAPYTFVHRIEDMAIVTDAQVTGYITLQRALSHDYPAGDTLVSSALIAGDLQSRVANIFEQQTWTGAYSDELNGDAPTAQYNATTYPIDATNRGAITERWAIIFTGSTAFKIVGENVGEIAIGNTAASAAPTNPDTGVAYFTLDPAGWGAGWSAGNVLRFNTVGAIYPLWIARTVLQGDSAGDSDDFRLQIRGNADAT